MTTLESKSITFAVQGATAVSGLLLAPGDAWAGYVFAHGAGAGMTHPFMASVAGELARRGIATLRYQFPYMEQGGRRPDPPKIAHAAVRAAVAETSRLLPGLPLFAGGKSFGGRMTSQAQAASALPQLRGLIFLGFPLHPAGRPSQDRAKHLFDVLVPMLFLQGSRDKLAELPQLEPLCASLGSGARLMLFQDADHSFEVPARKARKDTDTRGEMLDGLAAWAGHIIASPSSPARAGR